MVASRLMKKNGFPDIRGKTLSTIKQLEFFSHTWQIEIIEECTGMQMKFVL